MQEKCLHMFRFYKMSSIHDWLDLQIKNLSTEGSFSSVQQGIEAWGFSWVFEMHVALTHRGLAVTLLPCLDKGPWENTRKFNMLILSLCWGLTPPQSLFSMTGEVLHSLELVLHSSGTSLWGLEGVYTKKRLQLSKPTVISPALCRKPIWFL